MPDNEVGKHPNVVAVHAEALSAQLGGASPGQLRRLLYQARRGNRITDAQHAWLLEALKLSREPGAGPGPAAVNAAMSVFVVGQLVKSLVVVVVVVFGLVWLLWGGSTDAHLRCAAHVLGDNSLLSSAACVVDH